MRELLYIPEMDPPEQVLHHALLYRDSLSTLMPDAPEKFMADRTRLAYDAGVFRPRLVRDLWSDPVIFRRSVAAFYFRRPGEHPTQATVRATYPSLGTSCAPTDVQVDARCTIWEEILGPLPCQPCDLASYRQRGIVRIDLGLGRLPQWSAVATASTALALVEQGRRDWSSPLVVPCHPPSIAAVLRDCGLNYRTENLLARVDVGSFLPEAPPGIDTASVIAFRQRHDDERGRLIKAVEQLVREASKAHGRFEVADIARDVHEELQEALADMEKAAKSAFRNVLRRVAWFTVASSAGPASAAGSVAANLASASASRSGKENPYTYLYRVQNELDGFKHMSP